MMSSRVNFGHTHEAYTYTYTYITDWGINEQCLEFMQFKTGMGFYKRRP
jgi:hypothetical protein